MNTSAAGQLPLQPCGQFHSLGRPCGVCDNLPSFCDTWPWPNSDMDLVTPDQNMAVHRNRGCCKGGLKDA